MRIRFTDPPRIEWKELVGGRRVGRTISVTHKNLERYGVPSPGPGKPLTRWHATRLLAVLTQQASRAFSPESLMLSNLIATYLENVRCANSGRERKERVLRRSSKDHICVHVKVTDISLLHFLGDVPIISITGEDLLRWRNQLEDGGYSSMTVRAYLVDVRAMFHYALRHKYLQDDPSSVLTLPPSEPAEAVHFLSKAQIAKLFELAGDPLRYDPTLHYRRARDPNRRGRFQPIPGNSVISLVIRGLVYFGLRRSELVRVRWEDVDLDGKVLMVRGARKNPAKRERRRAVPICDPMLDCLSQLPRSSVFVFVNSQNQPWSPDALNCALKRFRTTYRSKLGFDFDFQTLRRTFGSLLYQSGYSLDQVAEFLGHADIKTTRTWYVALRAQDHSERITRALAIESGDGTALSAQHAATRSTPQVLSD